jgi:hypothetical protein
VETLHEQVETVLHKLEGAVAELDKRKAWRNILATTRRGPWILGGAAVLVVALVLRRKGEEVKRKSGSPGRAIVAGGLGLMAMLAKRWAKRLWSGQA